MITAALQIPAVERLCPPAPVTTTEEVACAVASWSAPAQIALFVGVLLALAALVHVGRTAYRRYTEVPRGAYPDQPTVPIVFPASERPPAASGGRGFGSRPARTRGPSRNDEETGEADRPSEMIGSPHGPPEEETRARPDRSVKVAESESEVEADGSSAAGGRRSDGGRTTPERQRNRPRRPGSESEADATPEEDDRTLQLLPGRMEIVSGNEKGREIRFVSTSDNEYTFGRKTGSGPGHFQLRNPTVSREHAVMRYVNGRWRIRNQSSTNPLTINGVRADSPGKEYTLSDGDRVEMGEIAFLYREK